MQTLEEKLSCAFAEVGVQVGDIIRCMIEQEIAANFSRIQQLNSLLSGEVCATTDETASSAA
jgi:hypothetical protein